MVPVELRKQTWQNNMDRHITNRPIWLLKKDIPAATIVGMFFFSVYCIAGNLPLATDLFEQGEWELCRRECRRALLENTEPRERFQLLEAMCLMRENEAPQPVVDILSSLVASNVNTETTAVAAYELGRLQWKLDESEAAFDSLALSFNSTTNEALRLRSSCSMFLLLKEYPKLKGSREDPILQYMAFKGRWKKELFHECARPDPSGREPKSPNWLIRFYRSQISPAIGDRCTLEPSCSEYYNQAHEKHGILGIPIVIDRFIREPEVNAQKKDPVLMESGQIRYRDPVENHDFWMKKK